METNPFAKDFFTVNDFVNRYPNLIFSLLEGFFNTLEDKQKQSLSVLLYTILNNGLIVWTTKSLQNRLDFENNILSKYSEVYLLKHIINKQSNEIKQKKQFWESNELNGFSEAFFEQQSEELKSYFQTGQIPENFKHQFAADLAPITHEIVANLAKDINKEPDFENFDYLANFEQFIEMKKTKFPNKITVFFEAFIRLLASFSASEPEKMNKQQADLLANENYFEILEKLHKPAHTLLKNGKTDTEKINSINWNIAQSVEKMKMELPKIKTESIKPTPQKSLTLSFGYKSDNTLFLEKTVNELNYKIDFLNQAKTSVTDFVRVMTSPDLSKQTEMIYFSCQTNEIKYVIESFQPYFSHLKRTYIEKSALFYTKEGKLLKKNSLYSSSTQKLLKKDEIDNVFKRNSVLFKLSIL